MTAADRIAAAAAVASATEDAAAAAHETAAPSPDVSASDSGDAVNDFKEQRQPPALGVADGWPPQQREQTDVPLLLALALASAMAAAASRWGQWSER